jgi:hypothetical protein
MSRWPGSQDAAFQHWTFLRRLILQAVSRSKTNLSFLSCPNLSYCHFIFRLLVGPIQQIPRLPHQFYLRCYANVLHGWYTKRALHSSIINISSLFARESHCPTSSVALRMVVCAIMSTATTSCHDSLAVNLVTLRVQLDCRLAHATASDYLKCVCGS